MNHAFSSHLLNHCLFQNVLIIIKFLPFLPGTLDSQCFHCIFPAALPQRQCNILYTAILQQPSLIANLEWQSLYEEDDSIESLVCVFHHLCSTQIYLGSREPHTDHVISSTLHITPALDDTLDLLHDHRFHHHILTLPLCNLTLTWVFQPIYCTLSAVEQDACYNYFPLSFCSLDCSLLLPTYLER